MITITSRVRIVAPGMRYDDMRGTVTYARARSFGERSKTKSESA